ncbi:sensor histidine kinase [Pseudomarimonas salicorniae]|uniref:histidine kinase n=1 Tax=Pseudomarimonas salicorniae TaxID=2933270 RepID=A0ABT0GJL4_9GAMM|nr:ATP-binding protein [Lysobacter sp. CAU 1642]MCK7594731.1 ATP-binding protein [Lysobacter sp. CAU 1642]
MTIQSRTAVLLLGLQLAGLLAMAFLAARWEAIGEASRRQQRIEAQLAAQAQRIDHEGELLARAAVDLAIQGALLHQQRGNPPGPAWHARVQAQLGDRLERLPEAIGGGWWFEPGAVEPGRRHYGPFVYRDGSGVVFTWALSTPEYDYHSRGWYLAALPRDWERDRRRPRNVYWSAPYYDEASGSSALMLTLGAPMHDAEGRVIGIATVDWSLDALRELIRALAEPGGQQAFLVDRRSGSLLAFSADPGLAMTPVALQPWAAGLNSSLAAGSTRRLADVELAGVPHAVHVRATRAGLLLGTLTPIRPGWEGLFDTLPRWLWWALVIGMPIALLVLLVLSQQRRPLDKVLAALRQSLVREPGSDRLLLRPMELSGRNEFTPLIERLNALYAEINADTERTARLNETLQARQAEIAALNASLEQRINERTFELEANNAELQRTVSALSRLQGQLVEVEKHGSMSRLVAGIAHDINTPLGVAVTAASHLQDLLRERREVLARAARAEPLLRQLVEDGEEGLGMLLSNLQRAAALVRSVKQISVDQSGEGRRRFDFAAYLEDVLLSLRPQHKRLPHRVQLDCPRGIELDSFPGAWAQVVTNLVMNALNHAFAPGSAGLIEVSGRIEGGAIELRVRDNGLGIPADRQSRIFEAFFTTGAQHGGTGLGLAVVRDLVEQRLGGRIDVISAPGQGSEFLIRAPLSSPGNGHPG